MCGRFTQEFRYQELHAYFDFFGQPVGNLEPRYNICPTDPIIAWVRHRDGARLERLRWGLVPAWWKKSLKEVPATFNARAETVAEKPMFRSAFKSRRCIIPASGYYEWKDTPTGKQPYYFTSASGPILLIAGLWDAWKSGEGEVIHSATMVITSANAFMCDYHDRMPVLLRQGQAATWLEDEGDTQADLMRPVANDALKVWPVSKAVNSSKAVSDRALIGEVKL